jgi:hypothetical protein
MSMQVTPREFAVIAGAIVLAPPVPWYSHP